MGIYSNIIAIGKAWLAKLDITFTALLLKIVSALVIILVGFIAAKLVSSFFRKIMHDLEVDRTASAMLKKNISLEDSLSKIISYAICIITIILALNQLGITSIILYMIAGFILLLLIIMFIVGFKDLLPNIFASFALYRKSNFRPGDRIIFRNIEGVVEEMNFLETKIRTRKGELIFIPNSTLIKSEIIVKKMDEKHGKRIRGKL